MLIKIPLIVFFLYTVKYFHHLSIFKMGCVTICTFIMFINCFNIFKYCILFANYLKVINEITYTAATPKV